MSLAVWIFLLCIGWPLAYALWSFLRAAWGPRRNGYRRDVLGRPWDDPRNVSGKYMETLRNNGRFS